MTDEFLTVQDIAVRLAVHPATVRNWCKRGLLPAFHAGNKWLIRRSEFEAVLREGGDLGAYRSHGVGKNASAVSGNSSASAKDARRSSASSSALGYRIIG